MIPLLFMTTLSPKFINEPTPEAPPVEALSLAISDHAPDESPATNALPLALSNPRAPITAVSPAIPTLHPNLSSVVNVDVGVYTTFVDDIPANAPAANAVAVAKTVANTRRPLPPPTHPPRPSPRRRRADPSRASFPSSSRVVVPTPPRARVTARAFASTLVVVPRLRRIFPPRASAPIGRASTGVDARCVRESRVRIAAIV